MESPNPSLDRILQAVSPVLAEELERRAAELRQVIEADFETKMQAAVEDARERAMEKGAYELQLAIDDARQMVRTQVTRELQLKFDEALAVTDQAHGEAARQFESERSAWNIEKNRLQQQLDEWKTFAEAQRQLAAAGSQAEILIRWLRLAEPFASSVAMYTVKTGGLALWNSRGKAIFPEIVSQETIDPEFYFRSIEVRGKTVAAVCAIQPRRADALDFLAEVMELAIEVFGLRLRGAAARSSDIETARVR